MDAGFEVAPLELKFQPPKARILVNNFGKARAFRKHRVRYM